MMERIFFTNIMVLFGDAVSECVRIGIGKEIVFLLK